MPDLRKYAVVYLKGMVMGAADTVPGVSGGTIALVVGIYERLIQAITGLRPDVLRFLPGLYHERGRKKFYRELIDRDVPFLLVLGTGVVSAVVVLSRVVHAALGSYRAQTFAFFLGLILASAIVLYEQLSFKTAGQAISGVSGFIIAFLVTGATATGLFPHDLPFIFLAGVIAISAMVLPGISGAFLLLIMGQYTYLTGVLSRFTDGVLSLIRGGEASGLLELASVIMVFGMGASVGILTVAHTVERMLERYRLATMTFLVSLMLGSLRLPVAEILSEVQTWSLVSGLSIILPALSGAIAVLMLNHHTEELSYQE